MRNVILNNIKDGLEEAIGKYSTYNDYKVEQIEIRLPKTVLVNSFVGIVIERVNPEQRSIGKSYPFLNRYICNLVIRIKYGDYDDGQQEVDRVLKRIIKYFGNDTGSLNGLSDTTDGVTETVVTYAIDRVDFFSGESQKNKLLHLCSIDLIIKTDLNIS